jgi:hypothetical protein
MNTRDSGELADSAEQEERDDDTSKPTHRSLRQNTLLGDSAGL